MRETKLRMTANVIAALSLCVSAHAEEFGGFAPVVNYQAVDYPSRIAVSDFDRNGTLDLAVANRDGETVTLHHGLGDGTFAPAVPIDAGYRPQGCAARRHERRRRARPRCF